MGSEHVSVVRHLLPARYEPSAPVIAACEDLLVERGIDSP